MKKHLAVLFTLSTGWAALSGCASDSGAHVGAEDRPAKRRRAVAEKSGSFESSPGAAQMGLQNEVGVYEGQDVEEALSGHMEAVRDCYGRAGRAQRFAGGQVMLRFLVGGDGTPQDVRVIATDLGNYEVERCLVGVGRRVKFPAPNGGKATTFEYPVEFRSTHEINVQDLADSLKVDHDVATFIHSLSSCGSIAEGGASAILYIEPSGSISSVGLAAESALDEEAGACMVREMRRWRMSATLPGHVLRCRVNIPPVIAAAEPASGTKHSTLVSNGRKHRR